MKSRESVSDYFAQMMAIINKIRIRGDKMMDGSVLVHEQKINQQEKEERTLKVLTDYNHSSPPNKAKRGRGRSREQKVEAATIPSLIGQSQQISPMWNALDVTGMVIINLNVKQI
ncbi:hypothetical protein CK203_080912 [Vitis vinifera]|uniref:Uncharacterized protein n=1 Tax=Vitis vinifera TaxID=29760 RepID=A0A438C0D3_VITVI|nr:hypothetical protein CK203_080912 [Vitis vinifera]